MGHEAAIYNETGITNTSVGQYAAYSNLSGDYNTSVGYSAAYSNTTFSNTTALGYGAAVTGSDQVQLGNSSTTTYAYGAVQARSDERDKADIKDATLGLDFLSKLRPVEFKWDYREDYKEEVYTEVEKEVQTEVVDPETGETTTETSTETETVMSYVDTPKDGSKKRTRFHQGLIAQEVKAVMDELGVDFSGYQDHSVNGGEDRLTIGYTSFIAPMIKAIQELKQRVEELENV